jgi:dihydrofolate reductase (trimethoprim resistance protein)|tara:strand:- start:134 stop:607 length:474 start_codon:yes stop_codon:yes gene_type:complete
VKIAMVAAQSENQVIGRGLEIPWKVKGEQALFKKITINGTLIMGRKTFQSIGRPLPGRTTIVVSRDPDLTITGCETSTSLELAIARAAEINKPIFIAGGGELYRQALDIADEIHLTTIHTKVEGDVLFPEVPANFRLVEEKAFTSNINYTYRHFERG